MEIALRYELSKIEKLKNKIFPTNAPEGERAPYTVYITKNSISKNLDGFTNDKKAYVMLNIFADSYKEMKEITKLVKQLVISFPLREIGERGIYIQDINDLEISETYENELKLQRGIISFEIYYKEE